MINRFVYTSDMNHAYLLCLLNTYVAYVVAENKLWHSVNLMCFNHIHRLSEILLQKNIFPSLPLIRAALES
jgi:hypothetical protein